MVTASVDAIRWLGERGTSHAVGVLHNDPVSSGALNGHTSVQASAIASINPDDAGQGAPAPAGKSLAGELRIDQDLKVAGQVCPHMDHAALPAAFPSAASH